MEENFEAVDMDSITNMFEVAFHCFTGFPYTGLRYPLTNALIIGYLDQT